MTIQVVETEHLKDFPPSSARIASARLLDADNIVPCW